MAVSNKTMSAAEAWKAQIEAHNQQTIRTRGDVVYEDMWSTLAQRFKDDPRERTILWSTCWAGWPTSESTVLDVGGGAGRYALPLALRAKHVTVVDPSPSMLEALRESAANAGIENVSAVQASWEDAQVTPHDVVLCANVVYGVAEIGEFVRKLEKAARDRVAIVLYMDAPLSRMSPIWTEVHGEKRIDMPGLPELLPVLWEMEIYPDVAMLAPATSTRTLPNLETAIAMARHFLYIEAGSEKEQRLREIAPRFVFETPGGRDDARGERAAAGCGVVGDGWVIPAGRHRSG